MTKTEALSHFRGSVAALASVLDISTVAVYLWAEDAIPVRRALEIEKIADEVRRRTPAGRRLSAQIDEAAGVGKSTLRGRRRAGNSNKERALP